MVYTINTANIEHVSPSSKSQDTATSYFFPLKSSRFGKIAQRRVTQADTARQQAVEGWIQHWSRRHPHVKVPVFHEIRWTEDPHPGSRVAVPVSEPVSPKTVLTQRAPWENDEEYRVALAVAEERRKGRRRPGMTLPTSGKESDVANVEGDKLAANIAQRLTTQAPETRTGFSEAIAAAEQRRLDRRRQAQPLYKSQAQPAKCCVQ